MNEIIGAIAYRDPTHLPIILSGLSITLAVIFYLKGRSWALIYLILIPALNWTFGKADHIDIALTQNISFNPLTILTGLVFVIRDFAQREMGHKILFAMIFAIGWSFYYAYPPIAIASGLAFAISETADWIMYTFTRYRLSTRIWLSSLIAAPIDTTVFLYGASLVNPDLLSLPNWILFVIGKLIGAAVVSAGVRAGENAKDREIDVTP